jgi:hypothetical protein
MDCEHLLQQLGTAIGLDLRFSESNTCGVLFDNDEVIFEKNEGKLHLIAALGPSAGRDDVCRRLLEANYLGAQTGFASIGLDSGREDFVLHRVLEGNMDYPEFEEAVTLFVRAARHWRKWLANPQGAQEASGERPFIPGGLQA